MNKASSQRQHYPEFGEVLRKALPDGISQVCLARRLYVSPPAVNLWMNGRRRPLPGTLGLLAAELQLSPDYLAHLVGYDTDPDALDKVLNAYLDRRSA